MAHEGHHQRPVAPALGERHVAPARLDVEVWECVAFLQHEAILRALITYMFVQPYGFEGLALRLEELPPYDLAGLEGVDIVHAHRDPGLTAPAHALYTSGGDHRVGHLVEFLDVCFERVPLIADGKDCFRPTPHPLPSAVDRIDARYELLLPLNRRVKLGQDGLDVALVERPLDTAHNLHVLPRHRSLSIAHGVTRTHPSSHRIERAF